MVQTTILNAINNGNTTVEQIKENTNLSPMAIKTGITELIQSGIIAIDGKGNYYNAVSYGVTEAPKKEVSLKQMTKGGNMNKVYNRQNTGRFRVDPELNCTPEQEAFAELVNNNKGRIFDADQVLVHRGCEILFAGAGKKALRYRIAVELNLSDKEPVEEFPLYLDWDDSALYDEEGIADQIRAILGVNSIPKTKLRAVKLGQMAGK